MKTLFLLPSFLRGVVLGVTFALITCVNDGDKGSGQGGSNPLEGIYQLNHYTENPNGCTVEGPSILAGAAEPLMAIYSSQVFGYPIVAALACLDTADCRQRVQDAKDAGIFGFFTSLVFDAGNTNEGYVGTVSNAWGIDSLTCTGQYTEHRLILADSITFQIESRTTNSANFPRDSEGFCDAEDAETYAQGQLCVEYSVRRGVRTARL